jgi:hypothetical protein
MKEVSLSDYKVVSPFYISAPQPMRIYHSIKEFEENVIKKGEDFVLLRSPSELADFIKTRNLTGGSVIDTVKLNLWIATYEEFIPDVWTKDDCKMWKLNEKFQVIKTDNCFIQVFTLNLSNRKTVLLYTSSGIYGAGLTEWNISAAVKPQFGRVFTTNRKQLGGRDHNANLEKFLARKRASVSDAQVVGRMLNPESPFYMKPFEAVKSVFKNKLKKNDVPRYLSTDRIAKLFLKELGVIMPSLQKAFLENITDKEMVEFAKNIFTKSLEKGTTAEQMDAYNLIYGLRQNDPDEGEKVQLIGTGQAHLSTGKSQEILIDKPPVEHIITYDDTDLAGKADEHAVIITDAEAETEKKKIMDKLRSETDSIPDYVQ